MSVEEYPKSRTYKLTNALRWNHKHKPPAIFVESVLEQAWQCLETGELDWRPIQQVNNGEELN